MKLAGGSRKVGIRDSYLLRTCELYPEGLGSFQGFQPGGDVYFRTTPAAVGDGLEAAVLL